MKRIFTLSAVLALVLWLVVSCGETSDGAADEVSTEATIAEDAEAVSELDQPGDVVVETVVPQRIVSLSPTATEILFAIGAGDQVVAADQYSDYPPEAPTTELDAFNPNLEAILAYDPDLVVLAYDANDLVAGLEEVEVPIVFSAVPSDIESGYEAVAELGSVIGRIDEAANTVATMRAEMDAAFAAAPDARGLRIYHEIDETFYSASSNGFVGEIYAAMGFVNIADEADVDASGFPQLTEEYIVESDPQLIVIADQAPYSPEDVADRDGWGEIAAVENANIVVVNADLASRWGPRLPQFVNSMAEVLNDLSVES